MTQQQSQSLPELDEFKNRLEREERARSLSRWEHFQHGSDIGVRGIGPSAESAFAQAGLALTAVLTDLDGVDAQKWIDVRCKAPNIETLFLDWLNALVCEMAHRDMVFNKFHVRLRDGQLTARLGGQNVHHDGHDPTIKIKGAKNACLGVDEQPGQCVAQCIIDV